MIRTPHTTPVDHAAATKITPYSRAGSRYPPRRTLRWEQVESGRSVEPIELTAPVVRERVER